MAGLIYMQKKNGIQLPASSNNLRPTLDPSIDATFTTNTKHPWNIRGFIRFSAMLAADPFVILKAQETYYGI